MAGIGLLIAAVVMPLTALKLQDNGVRANASVLDIQHSGKTTNYELSFNLKDGTPFAAWTDDVHTGTQIGETIQIAYDSGDPSTLEDVRDLGTWWVAPVIFGPLGIFFLWFGCVMWQGDPEAFKRALRARYGRP